MDRVESYNRVEKRRRREKILDNFVLAEVTAISTAELLMAEGKPKLPRPWEYYPELFAEEKEAVEEMEKEKALEEYKEQRRRYIMEFNRRRQQG